MEKPETLNKNHKIWTIGWLITFGAIPLGSCLPGLPLLLISRLKALFKQRGQINPELPSPKLSALIIKVFYLFLVAMLLSAALSSYRWIALAQSVGFGLMIYIYMFGGRVLGRTDTNFFMIKCMPVLAVSSIVASVIALFRFFCFPLPDNRTVDIFTVWNGFGTVLIIVGGLTIGYLNWRGGKWRYLIIPYLGIIVPTLVLTKSRGGWFGFLAMLGTMALFKRRLFIIFLILVLIVSCVFLSVPTLKDRLVSSFFAEKNMARVYIWRATFNMIKDHPILGVGMGVYPFIYPKYILPGAVEPVVSFAHNIFLQVFAEFGAIGFILFFGFLFSVLYMSLRLALSGNAVYQGIFALLIGVLVHQQVDLPIWGFDIGGTFWIIIGLVLGLYETQNQVDQNNI